jgi:Holliday junction resolvase RusA-like endonuclease
MPKEYMEWRDQVVAELQYQGAVLLDEPLSLQVAFCRTHFELWYSTLDREENNRIGLARGDLDNLLGGIMDAGSGVLWRDDASIHQLEGVLR